MKFYKFLFFLPTEILYKLGIKIAQNLNIFHLLEPFFVFTLFRIRITPILKILLFFYFYSLFITLINILYLSFAGVEFDLLPIIRQISGLTLGFLFFLLLRNLFLKNNNKKALDFLVKSSTILIAWFVIFVDRKFLRISGSFTEPSHLGQYLVFIVIPSILILLGISNRRAEKYKLFLLLLLTFFFIFLAFSFTTYVRFAILLTFIVAFMKDFRRKIGIFFILVNISILACILYVSLFQNSYIVNQVTRNIYAIFVYRNLAYASASLIDRINIVFILKNMDLDLNAFLGIGFGLEKLYLNRIFPPDVLEIIFSVKQFPTYITSLWGKIILYSGIVGSLIFILLLKECFQIAKFIQRRSYRDNDNLNIIKASLASIYTYALIGIAPFQSIELWFWLAYLDALYIKERRGYGWLI